jgi:hypothetical protein
MKTMIETVLPYAKLCGNCIHARRNLEDNGSNKKDAEIVVCRLYSLINNSDKKSEPSLEDPEVNDRIIPTPSLKDAPEGYAIGWGDLIKRPGQAPSHYLTNNCILVSYKDTCIHFQKEENE